MSADPTPAAAPKAVETVPGYLAVIGGLPPQVFPLEPGRYVLGRAVEADFRLDHGEVSRRHCEIDWDGAACWVEDLQSQWGTRRGAEPILGRTALHSGDVLTMGGVLVLFKTGALPSPEELDRLAGSTRTESGPLPVVFQGKTSLCIPLEEHTTFGRDPASNVILNTPAVSRHHALVERVPEGFRVSDLESTAGSFVNGRRFDRHELVIGDRLQIGPFHFLFDGTALHCVSAVSGGGIHAREVRREANGRTLLDGISLDVPPSRFAGIIGPSGAGKSSLLAVLSGLARPASGTVYVAGVAASDGMGTNRWGFVPQEEIVHADLTVSEALDFAAQLRFPRATPEGEVRKLIVQTMVQLGLRDRAGTRIGDLSGGQRKRVSVAVELLARPSVLFLDEPTSGLDPATEFKLMEVLRDLADRGCTVLCTTHVMENVYLMDQIAVMLAGKILFTGAPREARDFFGVERLAGLYERLEEKPADEWAAEAPAAAAQPAPEDNPAAAPWPARVPPWARLPVLLRRQHALVHADWRNLALLAGQPIVLALLVAWVSADSALLLFFAYIAALWFGCSNAAQEIVRERPIYRRERIMGVGPGVYVTSKMLFLGGVTSAQAFLFYATLEIAARGVEGSMLWQVPALLLTACAAAGIGCLISALARNLMQAVLAVPLVLIPLILFSGYTVPVHEMKPAVARVSGLMPSFAAQRCMDLSFLWHRTVDHAALGDHWTSFRNLSGSVSLHTGDIFNQAGPGLGALLTLALWTAGTAGATVLVLRLREKS